MNTLWMQGLAGGLLIGLSTTLLLWFNGRIAGLSHIFSEVFIKPQNHNQWRWYFIGGLLVGGVIYEYLLPGVETPRSALAPAAMIIGGLFVGIGTRMGNGCTSGHGVCGLGRLSGRSLVAVITFMATAMITMWIVQQI